MDTKETLGLREQVMINQLASIAGCTSDEARLLLNKSKWQFETALSIFLTDQCSPPGIRSTLQQSHYLNQVPSNTPATPPNFPETLLAFSKLSTDFHSKATNGVQQGATGTNSAFAVNPSVQQQQHWSANN